MQRLRLASVPYLNAGPLIWGFRHGPFQALAEVREEPPCAIAGRLIRGEADVGLIPSIEYQRARGLEVLPHLCIASKRRARSVILASRVPFEEVRSVALDENSRTSAALLRILLAHRGAKEVRFHESAPSLPGMLADHDAALLIGDAALTADTTGLRVYDLAAEWHGATRLPFVFAVWAARPGLTLSGGLHPFLESLRMGMARVPELAAAAALRLAIPAPSLEEYLRVNMHYQLGPEEIRALDLFHRQAHELGLVEARRPILFRDAAEAATGRLTRGRP